MSDETDDGLVERVVKVTRTVKSSKTFTLRLRPDEDAEDAAIELACEEPLIAEGVNDWTEDLDWKGEVEE